MKWIITLGLAGGLSSTIFYLYHLILLTIYDKVEIYEPAAWMVWFEIVLAVIVIVSLIILFFWIARRLTHGNGIQSGINGKAHTGSAEAP